jgi:hypothetical protein
MNFDFSIISTRMTVASFRQRSRGAALVIVLAFIVMLLTLLMAYFSKGTLQNQIASSSSNLVKEQLLAQSAIDTVISGLKQEIEEGSTNIPVYTNASGQITSIYPPKNQSSLLPAVSGFTTNEQLVNLLKITKSGGTMSRAAPAPSTEKSLNGRSVTLDRWNKPLLLPSTAAGTFPAPDWVLVARDGSSPTTFSANMRSSLTNPTSILGRYAYTLYNVGGLLDANVAGYPSSLANSSARSLLPIYKGGTYFADLKQIGMTISQIDQLVGWRNYATAQASGTYPSYGFQPTGPTNYAATVVSTTNGFMRVSTNAVPGPSSTATVTDRHFTGRQQLLEFLKGINASQYAMYLTSFSRSLDQPSYAPNPNRPRIVGDASQGGNSGFEKDDLINPSFLTIRAKGTFTRNDGTIAQPGEPLVRKRFALNRLAWLTYKGPSAGRNLGGGSATSQDPDADIYALQHDYGMPESWLKQGDASRIQNYFGLSWGGNYWTYSPKSGGGTSILTLSEVADQGREPNFVELLKAAILAGSVGKDWPNDPSDDNPIASGQGKNRYTSLDCSIMQIAANIIAQSTCDGFPPRIKFGSYDFYGVKNLPFLYRTRTAPLLTKDDPQALAGGGATSLMISNAPASAGVGEVTVIQEPEIWNPNAWNTNDTTGFGMGNPRPTNFQLVAKPQSATVITPYSGSVAGTASMNAPVSSTLTFDVPATTNGAGLFREPTLLLLKNIPTGSHLNGTGNAVLPGVYGTPFSYILTTSSNVFPNGFGFSMNSSLPQINQFLGIYIGKADASWQSDSNVLAADRYQFTPSGSGFVEYSLQCQNGSDWIPYDRKLGSVWGNAGIKTLYLQWLAGPFSTYIDTIPYQTVATTSAPKQSLGSYQDFMIPGYNSQSVFDPRTARFGFQQNNSDGSLYANNTAPPRVLWQLAPGLRWGSPHQNVTETERPNLHTGYRIINGANNLTSYPPQSSAGWSWGVGTVRGNTFTLAHGLFAQNIVNVLDDGLTTDGEYRFGYESSGIEYVENKSQYFADPDGVVRRGMAGHVQTGSTPATTTVGIPLATAVSYDSSGVATPITAPTSSAPTTNSDMVFMGNPHYNGTPDFRPSLPGTGALYSRPVILNRPFRTVGELAYTFSDTPWRNLDLSSPESGCAALLDVFCIQDTTDHNGLVAGKVDLNTPHQSVINAVLSGSYIDTYGNASYATMTPTLAGQLTTLFMARTRNLSVSTMGPLRNLSELVGKQVRGNDFPTPIDGTSPNNFAGFSSDLDTLYSNNVTDEYLNNISRFREAPIRALAAAGQTRFWNLMLDLVVQTGRYPQSATSLNRFMVEGEAHYWVHIAIDRLTGQVIDKQIEVVND